MKIIQVIPLFGMGGAEIMCENLVYELKKLGHEVIVVSLYNEKTAITERMEKSCIDIRYLDKKSGFDVSMFGKLKTLFKKEKPNVIHTHIYAAKYVFPVASKMNIRVVHTIHNVADKETSKITRFINGYYFKHSNVVPVALSKQIHKTVADEYSLKSENIPIVLNGIDLSKCMPKTDYIIQDKFKILHIGRFYEQKNHIGLLKAFKIFYDRHNDSELWLIGDGEKKAEIENYVKENGLEVSVKFLGSQDYVYGYLHNADIFTLPSNYEGIPITIIEAMGTGLPIVATAVGGVQDMLDEDFAQLVPVDTMAIADAFEKYYLSYDLRKNNGEKALQKVKQFSSEIMAKRYLEIYCEKGKVINL